MSRVGGQRAANSSPALSKNLALQADVSMLHLEHIHYFIILVIFEGNPVWVHGVVRRCVCISSGLCSSWWDASSSLLALGFFQVPCAVPMSCLSSAQRSQLKASLGLAWFRVVYGQAKWNCPYGQPERATCCWISHSVMLPRAHGHCLIYFLDSPFCLIKRKKNPPLSKAKPTRPLSTYAAFNYD